MRPAVEIGGGAAGSSGDQVPASQLELEHSHLAQSLYALEDSPDVGFVRAASGCGGPTGRKAADIVSAITEIWTQYLPARDRVQQLVSAAAARRHGVVERLWRPDVVTLPQGMTTTARALLVDLQRQVDEATASAAGLASEARRAMTGLDTVTATFAGLVKRAVALGAEHDVEIVEARRRLARAVAAAADEPTTSAPPQLGEAIEAARRRVDQLELQHATLPAALAAAHAQLDEIRRLVPSGAEALAEARKKIGPSAGLRKPLDPAGLEGGERALQPWLAQLDAHAAARRWQAAAAGLEQWQQRAATWLTDARDVLTANRSPVVRRDELRGLLAACQARAAASGRAEDPDLIDLGRAADDALHRAPCDLGQAEARVLAYASALRAGGEANRP